MFFLLQKIPTSNYKIDLHTISTEYMMQSGNIDALSEQVDRLNISKKTSPKADKKTSGQFYTTRVSYIFDGLNIPWNCIKRVVEPFAGRGDLIEWTKRAGFEGVVDAYDIDPKYPTAMQRDTLLNPPSYEGAWIITNPPYLARNKSHDKQLFDKYDTNDLYKCFMLSICANVCDGGIIIIPAGIFLSPRDIDFRCRALFMRNYRILHIKYFEESVFNDTKTTVVAVLFEKFSADSPPVEIQHIAWTLMPSGRREVFPMAKTNQYIIGGEIYQIQIPENITIRRHVEGLPLADGEQQTFITLCALDSGKANKTSGDGRIGLTYKKNHIYQAKPSSRTFATLRVSGCCLSDEEQKMLCIRFNTMLEQKRSQTHSMFLPQFRESKDYARKRMPFGLAYRMLGHIIGEHIRQRNVIEDPIQANGEASQNNP